MNKEILLHADEQYTPATTLKAGHLQMIYEEGRIRYIKAGETTVVHLIYAALRDKDWNTIDPVISHEKIDRQKDSFQIRYDAAYTAGEINYRATFSISGTPDGTINFRFQGESLSDFSKNRIGLCVLLPIASQGDGPLHVTRPDGSAYNAPFPELVSPHQPFFDVAGARWTTVTGIETNIIFHGEVFEIEDQRNWSDSSYKIYSTPLSIPAPAMVKKGDRIDHTVTITARTTHSAPAKHRANIIDELIALPAIGYCRPKGTVLHEEEIELLLAVPFDHYRVELDMTGAWQQEWEGAKSEATKLNTRIELVLLFAEADITPLDSFLEALKAQHDMISSVLVLAGEDGTAPVDFFTRVRTAIKGADKRIPVGYGTNGHFADLNRNRPEGNSYDFVSFALHPQVHQTDSRTIMENLGSQDLLIQSAKHFTEGKSVHVSPVRFSSAGHRDNRFTTDFAAWWTLKALRNLRTATSLTFFDVTGENGLIQDGKPTRVYEVLRQLAAFVPRYIVGSPDAKVVFENKLGHRLTFQSEMAPLDKEG